jgi:hypothetical protein
MNERGVRGIPGAAILRRRPTMATIASFWPGSQAIAARSLIVLDVPMSTRAAEHRPVWGLAAFLVAAVALVAVTLHVSGIFAEPQRSAATTIGEIAAEIRDSARRALAPPGWTAERALTFAVPILAGMASMLGAIGLFRREAPTLPAIAIGMGCCAFVMQYVFWLALVIGGFCLLVAIMNNIDGILGG